MKTMLHRLTVAPIVFLVFIFLFLFFASATRADEYGYRLCLENNGGGEFAKQYCQSLRQGPAPADPSPGSAEEERLYKICVEANRPIMGSWVGENYCTQQKENARKMRELRSR